MSRLIPEPLREPARRDVQVLAVEGFGWEPADAREPHRHDYQEVIWIRSGHGVHRIDGIAVEAAPGTLTLVGRGQVHVFEQARDVSGTVVRFGEAAVAGAEASSWCWMFGGTAGPVVGVPPEAVDDLERLLGLLASAAGDAAEDRVSVDLRAHLLSALLLLVERWQAAGLAASAPGDMTSGRDALLYRRFAELLERDFRDHHDAAHYADALRVPAPALSRALGALTGRTTKQLITDRVMLEAARLLRFGDDSVKQVAFAVGFEDPLHFSRAFKQRYGRSPQAYRAA